MIKRPIRFTKTISLILVLCLFLCTISSAAPATTPKTTYGIVGETATAGYNSIVEPFVDVPADEWFSEGIAICYEKGIITGTSPNTFSPDRNITRAEFVTMLFRATMMAEYNGMQLNKEIYGDEYNCFPGNFEEYVEMCMANIAYPSPPFDDVEEGSFYEEPVLWAYYCGFINGVSDTSFAPLRYISREDMMTILYRHQQQMGIDALYGKMRYLEEQAANNPEEYGDYITSLDILASLYGFDEFGKEIIINPAVIGNFSDGDSVAEYAADAVCWAVQSKYIEGVSSFLIDPQGKTTRAQTATILARMISNLEFAGACNQRSKKLG